MDWQNLIQAAAYIASGVMAAAGFWLTVRNVRRSRRHTEPEGEVCVFLTERRIGGALYGEQLCARSWREAERLAARIGARVLGTLEEAQCAKCGAVISRGEPERGPGDWDEVIDA
jgi:hypothetical protein